MKKFIALAALAIVLYFFFFSSDDTTKNEIETEAQVLNYDKQYEKLVEDIEKANNANRQKQKALTEYTQELPKTEAKDFLLNNDVEQFPKNLDHDNKRLKELKELTDNYNKKPEN